MSTQVSTSTPTSTFTHRVTVNRHLGTRFRVEVKRLYLPFTVTQPCPACGEVCVRNLSRDPAPSFPVLGEPVNLYGYCDKCDHEWEMPVVIDVTLTPVNAPTPACVPERAPARE